MNTTVTGHAASGSTAAEDRTTLAPIHRFAARVVHGMIYRHLRAQSARELRQLSERTRRDIGVPEHMIHEVAADLAARRADAWLARLQGTTRKIVS